MLVANVRRAVCRVTSSLNGRLMGRVSRTSLEAISTVRMRPAWAKTSLMTRFIFWLLMTLGRRPLYLVRMRLTGSRMGTRTRSSVLSWMNASSEGHCPLLALHSASNNSGKRLRSEYRTPVQHATTKRSRTA